MLLKLLSCSIVVLISPVSGSLYDPHLFPTSGPFFEGWYFRFVDHKNSRSFATLFGTVLPKDESKSHNPAYFGLLRQDWEKGKLLNYDNTPPTHTVHLTVRNGEKISKNPDTESPSDFTWKVDHVGHVTVNSTHAQINVTIGNVRVEADIGSPLVWDESGRGPMGWLSSLPLPLSWFVYSLGSRVNSYKWTDLRSGEFHTGNGFVHMEKNWGKSFPKGWIWTQGITADGNVSFAATYGPVGFGPIDVPGHLIGYRNYNKNISVDFRPDNSLLSKSYDGCVGSASFTLHSFSWKMSLVIETNPGTYSECLLGPMANGFRPVAEESYVADAHITLYQRRYLTWHQVDQQLVQMAALEFGGAFSCDKECVAK